MLCCVLCYVVCYVVLCMLCCVCCVVLFVCEMMCDYPIVIMSDIINIKHVQFCSVTNVHMFIVLMILLT